MSTRREGGSAATKRPKTPWTSHQRLCLTQAATHPIIGHPTLIGHFDFLTPPGPNTTKLENHHIVPLCNMLQAFSIIFLFRKERGFTVGHACQCQLSGLSCAFQKWP
jgi:hypothetical protein